MTAISIRQSGGSNIVSIPKAILKTLGLHAGSKLDLAVENNKIVLTPVQEETSLEELLLGSPKGCFKVTEEDEEWVNMKPVGKEL